ncbi:MAG: YXWGXW repeat-containing protein [Acidisphaera sp.]|nr:YXWGXW repeat-containing protein [Acidisphaera sp.]
MRRVVVGALLAAALAGTASAQLYPPVPPPRFEPPRPAPPGPPERYDWEPGHWEWDGYRYTWSDGHYVHRQYGMFIPGRWGLRAGQWEWIPPHWD